MTPIAHAATVAEKATRYGTEHRATTELVGVLLNCTVEKAEQLHAACSGYLPHLHQSPTITLTTPQRDKLEVLAEFAKRARDVKRDEGAPLRSPRDVWKAYASRLEDLPVEEFHVAVLDAQHRLERDITVTRGILNSSLVHPREVFREAIANRAAAIVLVHNHPSGDPTPSADDKAITAQLVAAGRLLDIPVADHVIIGRGRYLSFAEAGLL